MASGGMPSVMVTMTFTIMGFCKAMNCFEAIANGIEAPYLKEDAAMLLENFRQVCMQRAQE